MTDDLATEPTMAARPARGTARRARVFRWARWVAIGAWALALGLFFAFRGVAYDRYTAELWVFTGIIAASIGTRRVFTAVLDFAPFMLVLLIYDYLRGSADGLGMPTHWYAQMTIDKVLFFGHVPTVWLQEQLKYPTAQWWELPITLCYISYFALPVVTAGVMWLRSRRDFYRWSYRFVPLALVAFTCFSLFPAAPPWAAARCTAAQIAAHPSKPSCMYHSASLVHGGLLGRLDVVHAGAYPYVNRIGSRGFQVIHLTPAQTILQTGQATSDLVAAVPSLHSAGVLLFVLFMWRRVRPIWRVPLALYPLAMTFTLVFTGEHYVSDVLLGWLAAVAVHLTACAIERRWRRRTERRARPRGADPQAPAPAESAIAAP